MKMKSIVFGLLAAALVAGCSGGGSGGPYTSPITLATPVSTSSPSNNPNGNNTSVLSTANISGGPAFATASQQPVYVFDGDTVPNQSTCTNADGCLGTWPAVPPPAGVTISAPWSVFTRSDNGSQQLAYNGKPLYTFVSDTQPDTATGDGFQSFHLARPSSSSTPPPSGGGGY
jgi:predicted lipoprotein with Yx(FWY)xxD motif